MDREFQGDFSEEADRRLIEVTVRATEEFFGWDSDGFYIREYPTFGRRHRPRHGAASFARP
jgi:hypothetical protein